MQPGGEPGCYFSSFSIEYPIDYAAVGIVYLLPIEINVDVGHRISSMPQGGSNSLLGYVERSGNGRPAVARPVGGDTGEKRREYLLSPSPNAPHIANTLQIVVKPFGVILVIAVAVHDIEQVVLARIAVDDLHSFRLHLDRIEAVGLSPVVFHPPVNYHFQVAQVDHVNPDKQECQFEHIPVFLQMFFYRGIKQQP